MQWIHLEVLSLSFKNSSFQIHGTAQVSVFSATSPLLSMLVFSCPADDEVSACLGSRISMDWQRARALCEPVLHTHTPYSNTDGTAA